LVGDQTTVDSDGTGVGRQNTHWCVTEDVSIQFHATSFDESLAMTYFQEMAGFFQWDKPKRQLPGNLREYQLGVYSWKGELVDG
jgi:hypothetical protein